MNTLRLLALSNQILYKNNFSAKYNESKYLNLIQLF